MPPERTEVPEGVTTYAPAPDLPRGIEEDRFGSLLHLDDLPALHDHWLSQLSDAPDLRAAMRDAASDAYVRMDLDDDYFNTLLDAASKAAVVWFSERLLGDEAVELLAKLKFEAVIVGGWADAPNVIKESARRQAREHLAALQAVTEKPKAELAEDGVHPVDEDCEATGEIHDDGQVRSCPHCPAGFVDPPTDIGAVTGKEGDR